MSCLLLDRVLDRKRPAMKESNIKATLSVFSWLTNGSSVNNIAPFKTLIDDANPRPRIFGNEMLVW
jgi:hypothetical protein